MGGRPDTAPSPPPPHTSAPSGGCWGRLSPLSRPLNHGAGPGDNGVTPWEHRGILAPWGRFQGPAGGSPGP